MPPVAPCQSLTVGAAFTSSSCRLAKPSHHVVVAGIATAGGESFGRADSAAPRRSSAPNSPSLPTCIATQVAAVGVLYAHRHLTATLTSRPVAFGSAGITASTLFYIMILLLRNIVFVRIQVLPSFPPSTLIVGVVRRLPAFPVSPPLIHRTCHTPTAAPGHIRGEDPGCQVPRDSGKVSGRDAAS